MKNWNCYLSGPPNNVVKVQSLSSSLTKYGSETWRANITWEQPTFKYSNVSGYAWELTITSPQNESQKIQDTTVCVFLVFQ